MGVNKSGVNGFAAGINNLVCLIFFLQGVGIANGNNFAALYHKGLCGTVKLLSTVYTTAFFTNISALYSFCLQAAASNSSTGHSFFI